MPTNMPIVEPEIALLRQPRLAALATSPWPAWLWRADGSQILWTNAVGAAIFGAATVQICVQQRFDARGTASAQIIRLETTLPPDGGERLEQLLGFGAGFNRALTCACSRMVVGDGSSAVLVAATEAAGPTLTLPERVKRLFAGYDNAVAAFTPGSALVYINQAVQAYLPAAPTLSGLGLETWATTAYETGHAFGTARFGDQTFDVTAASLGKDEARVAALTFVPHAVEAVQQAGETAAVTAAPKLQPEPETTAVAETESIAMVPETASITAPPEQNITSNVINQNVSAEEPPAAPVDAHGAVTTEQNTASDAIDQSVSAEAPPAALADAPVAPPAEQNITSDVIDQNAGAEVPPAERRHPLRFVWHTDADGRFAVGSNEFSALVGSRTSAALGRPWSEIAAELKLDQDNRVARALASHETWSGLVVSWPVDDSDERLPVELSGLPVFDRDRSFRGYRGFGVCRDVARINELIRARGEHSTAVVPAPAPLPPQAGPAVTQPAAAAPNPVTPSEPAETAFPPARSVPAANVVPFRQSPAAPEPKSPPALSPIERRAFRELAQELTARLRSPEETPEPAEAETAVEPVETTPAPAAQASTDHALLDHIPIGILVYRHDALLFANRHFLEWSGYDSIAAIEAAGGVAMLFDTPSADALADDGGTQTFTIQNRQGEKLPAEGRMFTVAWNGASALALVLTNGNGQLAAARRALETAETESRELKAILDAATDGILTLDAAGRIVNANGRAASLFGRPTGDFAGLDFAGLLAPDSAAAARDFFDRVARGSTGLGHTLDVTARATDGQSVPLTMMVSRLDGDKLSAVFRDVSAQRQTQDELRNAKRETMRAGAAKAEFLSKVSHEIRTPLNAMTGFAEVIMAERFGPIGNERYREYVKDIHNAGMHLVSMLNDLLDLSRVETGQIDLTFSNVNLNELTQQCVGIMQPQANRGRIIIRTSLTPNLPLVVADERSLRQIALNLLANSIRHTGPGGQVIVSTVFSDAQEAVLRVRDTGAGMSEKDIQAALEPFQQIATSGSFGSGGTGFGLSLTKALAEANRAHFSIKSAPNAGTLVEVAFPPSRIVAD